MSEERCGLCKYWRLPSDGVASHCRRYPPHPQKPQGCKTVVRDWSNSVFPAVGPGDWCGEFERKGDTHG